MITNRSMIPPIANAAVMPTHQKRIVNYSIIWFKQYQ